MRKKIQSSMILVIALTLIIAYAITTLVVYRQTIHIMEGEVRQEADYINVAIDTSGESYLKIMDKVHKDTRITLIDSDGNVKYDSKEDEVTFQNHKNRPEVKEALKTGSGQDHRTVRLLEQYVKFCFQFLKPSVNFSQCHSRVRKDPCFFHCRFRDLAANCPFGIHYGIDCRHDRLLQRFFIHSW